MESLLNVLMKYKKELLLIISVLNFILLYSIWYESPEHSSPKYVKYLKLPKGMSCIYSDVEDALEAVDDNFSLPPWSIFFLETSCRGGLSSRQACSVESAARAHPLWQITVFFLAPVSENTLNHSFIGTLQQFENVQFVRIHLDDFTEQTPLEFLVSHRLLQGSPFPIENLSNALRFFILYKWGGIYLDTDMIVARSLEPLGFNWVGRENDHKVNTAVIALATDSTGSHLSADLIINFKKYFAENDFNGPKLLTRTLGENWCSPKDIKYWRLDNCQGISIYDASLIYPIDYRSRNTMFKEIDWDFLSYTDAFTYRTWNRFTKNVKIQKNSPYDQLATNFCPSIYNLFRSKPGV